MMVQGRDPIPSGMLTLSSGCLFLFGLLVFLMAAGAGWAVYSSLLASPVASLALLAVVLVFAAVGIGLMIWAGKRPGIARGQRLREARHPDSPWLWREDWEQGFARAEGRSGARFRMTAVPGV